MTLSSEEDNHCRLKELLGATLNSSGCHEEDNDGDGEEGLNGQ